MSPQGEVLEPAIGSKSEARKMIQQAVAHFRTAKRATIQVMADLRRLQDGEVHLLYGERNFAVWAEHTFDGLAAGNVKQLTRAGAIALELDRRGLIDLNKPEGVGTTALRELSVLANDYGNDRMAEIYKTASEMVEDGREVSATTIKAAIQLLMPPVKTELEVPDALPAEDDEEDEDEDENEKLPEKVRELVERIRDLSWDLPESADELGEVNEQLKNELAGKDTSGDEKWIASKR